MDFPSSSLAGLLNSLLIFFLILIYIFVTIRVYVRTQKTRKFGAADIFLLISVVLTTTSTLLTILSTTNGIGSSSAGQQPQSLSLALHYHFVATLTFILSSGILRIAAALDLLKSTSLKSRRLTISVLTGLSTLFSAWYFLLMLLECVPVSYYWEGIIESFSGGCLDPASLGKQGYAFAVVSGMSDIALGAGAVWCVAWEKLARRQKYGFVGVVGGAILAGTAAVLRVPATAMLIKTTDFFYDTASLLACHIVELGFGSVALSAAAFQVKKPKPATAQSEDNEKCDRNPSNGGVNKDEDKKAEEKKNNMLDIKREDLLPPK